MREVARITSRSAAYAAAPAKCNLGRAQCFSKGWLVRPTVSRGARATLGASIRRSAQVVAALAAKTVLATDKIVELLNQAAAVVERD